MWNAFKLISSHTTTAHKTRVNRIYTLVIKNNYTVMQRLFLTLIYLDSMRKLCMLKCLDKRKLVNFDYNFDYRRALGPPDHSEDRTDCKNKL